MPTCPRRRRLSAPRRRPTAVVYCEANFGEPGRQDRQRPGPPLGALRDRRRHRQRAGRPRRRRGARRRAQRHPVCTDLDEALAAAGRGPRRLHLRHGPLERHALAGERDAGARRHRPRAWASSTASTSSSTTTPSSLPPPRRARRRDPRRAQPTRQEGPAHVQRPHRRRSTCPRIAVLGTDGAIGKRTTATILTEALNDRGIKAVLVGTGQTGLIQGARYGVALDAIPCQFCSGEMESAVVEAFEGEHPDVIVVEGQGALSHPAYLTSSFILRGASPRPSSSSTPRPRDASATSPTSRCRHRPARSTSSRPSPTRRSSGSPSTTSR